MSFLTGFATGFAKSVDTQLRKSIERTRDNIDMISKFRLKQAEEREKKRKERGKELDDMLSNAAYVISGDANNPQAIQMAGDLLKEQGEKAFLTTISNIDTKQRESGISVMPFFTRGSETSTAQNVINPKSTLVNAFLDSDTSIPSMTSFPTDLKPGGGLVAKLTGADPFAIGETRSKELMTQMDIALPSGEVKDTTGLFGKTTFDIEGYKYETMDINQKVAYLQQEELKPGITKDELAKIKVRKDNLFKVATANGDLDIQINVLEDKLGDLPSDDPQRGTIANQLKNARRQKKMNEAESDPDESIALDLKATFALQDAVDENGNILNTDLYMEGINLRRKATDMKEPITNQKKLERLEADHQFRQENVDDYRGSDAEKQSLANIAQARLLVETAKTVDSNDITKELKNLEDMSSASIATVVGKFQGKIDYTTLADGSVRINMITTEEALNAVISAYTKQYDNLKKLYDNQGLDTRALDAAYQAAVGQVRSQVTVDTRDDLTGSVITDDAGGVSGALVSEGDQGKTPEEIQAEQEALNVEQEALNNVRSIVPNDETGVNSIVNVVTSDAGFDPNTAYEDVIETANAVHGPKFGQTVDKKVGELQAELRDVIVEQVTPDGKVFVIDPMKVEIAYGVAKKLYPDASFNEHKNWINMAIQRMNVRAKTNEQANVLSEVEARAGDDQPSTPVSSSDSITMQDVGDLLAKTGLMGRSMQYQTLLKDRDAQASAAAIDYTSLSMKDLQDIIKDSSASTDQVIAATDEVIRRSKQNKAQGGLMRRN